MKYLVTAKVRPAVAQAVSVALVQAAKEYINACLANGSMDCVYLFTPGMGAGSASSTSIPMSA